MAIKVSVTFLNNDVFKVKMEGCGLTSYVDKKEETKTPAGPNPLELLLSSLGSCVGIYAKKYLTRHEVPFQDISVAVSADFVTAAPARLDKISVSVSTDADLSDKKEHFMRYVRGCPVHNTITHTDSVAITFD